ncbi:MAG: serine/threonine-protein phosphatase [Prevotella sp.]|nr:serine/threonine-protein phosphatase [Prevotella sp.]
MKKVISTLFLCLSVCLGARAHIDIFGSLTPAKTVGGDLFDFYIHDEKLFFCIGDVSGKGVPASLVMAVARSLFRNVSAHVSEPEPIVKALNDAMTQGNDSNMFVTIFVGVLDLATGQLHYCNAGHDAPLLIGAEGCTSLPCDPNLPIGVMEDWQFTQQELTMQPGTTIFLYTDGLNEAENKDHEQFGMERVVQTAEQTKAEGIIESEAIVGRMTEDVTRFVDGAEQSDDLTMLAIRYTGNNDEFQK